MNLNYLGKSLSRIDTKWQDILMLEASEELQQLDGILSELVLQNTIFPPQGQIFDAFFYTKFDDLSVVIIGQDPYHGDGQANGLAFSVNNYIKIPPSLRNIFVELGNEYNIQYDMNVRQFDGELLVEWAKQGVLLLNNSLTVIKDKPNSLSHIGWDELTDRIINYISRMKNNVVFILWGTFANKKTRFIDDTNGHLILTSAHPSPLSAYRGFFGCNHFKLANQYLEKNGKNPINWILWHKFEHE